MVYTYYMSRQPYKKIYQWSPELAYIAGLIASDGCLVNNGRHINITSKDIEIINHFRNILEIKSEPRIKIGGFGTAAFNLQFSNVSLYDFFLACGLTPAKSKTIGPLNIPDIVYPDFLRGYFDGDGTIYGYKDVRWKNSYMYYVGYISASTVFLEWLQQMNAKLAQTTPGKIKIGTRAYVLNYAKADSQKLFKLMYSNPGIPMLRRKFTKFVAFLQSDPYASKELNARVLELVDRPR